MDRDKFEDFKTRFYIREGWDTATGWPTRSTLEQMGLKMLQILWKPLENWEQNHELL